jgi:hypothetical protein
MIEMDALFELLVYKIAQLVNHPVKIWVGRVTAKQFPSQVKPIRTKARMHVFRRCGC